MSEENWTVAMRQDPVLLDSERERIDAVLEKSGQRARRKRMERDRRIGEVRGRCSASLNRLDLADLSIGNPAYEMLQLYRIGRGNPDADFHSLLRSLGEPANTIGLTPLNISKADSLLHKLVHNERIRDGIEAVLAEYANLSNGLHAAMSRQSDRFGAFDGILPAANEPAEYSPRHYSASRLELYARCPLRYFYQELLKIRKQETAEFDRTRWLDALQRGSLLHGVFFEYMSNVAKAGGIHNRLLLDEICERRLEAAERTIPAPSPHILAKERDSIRQDVNVFWSMEQRRNTRPAFFELELQQAGGGLFRLELSHEVSIPLKGFVDRIDEIAPHRYQVIDYKTGRSGYYEDDAFYAGGTQIQHALYSLAVEQWLRNTDLDPFAEVVEAGYAFPTERGRGGELMRSQLGRKDETIAIVRGAIASMERGLFPPSQSPDACRSCDYATVCGTHAEWKKDARLLPENRELLAPLLEVNESV
jgi:ATP-dependent helicase/nuclease subunit B